MSEKRRGRELCEFEVKVLREAAGEGPQGVFWGAAMSEALESLHGSGLIARRQGTYSITEAGRQYLEGM